MKKYTNPFGDFNCVHCHNPVSADMQLSGVHNRNHCPYCLWSRHVDMDKAGDRLADCQSSMKPIGVTVKKVKKKYGGDKQGELMLIHGCTGCDKVSINRIAADDDAHLIWKIFEESLDIDERTRESIESTDIEMLTSEDAELVHTRLFGKGSWNAEENNLEQMNEDDSE